MNKTTESRLGGELRSQQASQRLLDELRGGRYAKATQLPSELELADVLGVSRTVVRDALSDLERDGYVERVCAASVRWSIATWCRWKTAWTKSWNLTG